MRNLKRVLSLALALVMVLGMMVITTSAADFTDADEITYNEAVDVISAIGVITGDNGKFYPNRVLSREEGAAFICYLLMGKNTASKLVGSGNFTDVAADRWSAGAIDYCNALGYISGYTDANGDVVFNPKGELTGVAYGKLLLCALGYDAAIEGYGGANWATNIVLDMMTAGLMVDGVNPAAPLTREVAAQMTLQALQAKMVSYQYKGTTITVNGVDIVTGASAATVSNNTFMSKYFKNLDKVEGVINQVGAKSVKLGNTTFTGATADVDEIGYAAYTWTLDGSKEDVDTKTAITDIVITGESLGVSTNGADFDKLIDTKDDAYVASVDTTGYDVYYNGVKQTKTADIAAAKAKADKVGVKVDFVDNDNAGKAEAVVVTEYTYTTVTSIVKRSVSGEISIAYYDLADGTRIYADELVCDEELGRGDHVAYVRYVDKTGKKNVENFYVTVLTAAEGELEYITRDKLNNETVKVYTIAGEDYIASQADYVDIAYLVNANINEDAVYVVDEYGYLVYAAAPAAAADDYLLVLDNEDSHGIKDLAEVEVVYADGTIDIIDVDCETDIEDGELADVAIPVYTYASEDGIYEIEVADEFKVLNVDSYKTGKVVMQGKDLTKGTTVVDLRQVLAGKADEGTVYVGWNEIPSFTNGKLYYCENRSGMDLAFLVAGKDPAAAGTSASFVVFDTTTNIVDQTKTGNTYELVEGVLVGGELKTNYVLSQAMKDAIDTFGVGVYSFKNDKLDKYTTFAQMSVKWTPEDYGTIIYNDEDITTDYEVIVLNIADGEIGEWDQLVKEGFYYSYLDEDAEVLYVVGDDVRSKVKASGIVDGVIGNYAYISEEGKVTVRKTLADADVTVVDENDDVAAVIAAAADGETIFLPAGEYDIDLGTSYMAAKDELIIVGNGNTRVSFNGSNTSLLNVKNLTIDGCTILKNEMPGRWGHLNFAGNGTGVTYTVSNCTFEGVGTQGIYINGTDGFKYVITGCTFIGDFGAECPITIQNNAGDYEVVVSDCTFENIPDDAYIGYWKTASWNPAFDWTLTTDVDDANIVYLPR